MLQSHSSFHVLTGQAEGAEVTWRGLYACGNGWRGLQPGCFEVLDMPSSSRGSTYAPCGQGFPPHCILDGGDYGWTPAGIASSAEGASELLVAVDWLSVQVTPPSEVCIAYRQAPS